MISYLEFEKEVSEFCTINHVKQPLIIAVSKTRSITEIKRVATQGVDNFGENYANDMIEKSAQLPQVRWHYIGHLQRRNVKKLIPHMYLLHTIDSPRLVDQLVKYNYQNNALIQVNISSETSKSGVDFNEEAISPLSQYAETNGINILGFMGIGSINWNNSTRINMFSRLIDMGKDMGYKEFSLGMSDDWRDAVIAGTTMIRVGRRIFGERKY